MSFRHALAFAEAIASGSLEPYARAHEQIGRLPHAMGALMLAMDRWPALEMRAMRALSSRPEIFLELVSAHLGATKLLEVALRRGPRLGWEMIAA